MCGRYALFSTPAHVREVFRTSNEFEFGPRYNIAPSQLAPVVCLQEGQRVLMLAKWGLMPHWAKEGEKLPLPINAKAETAAIRPMFRQAFRRSRVLVPADAFYEWKVVDGRKQPNLIRLKDETPFGLAGLLEHWGPPGNQLITFTILTTTANSLMAEIHDRMPVIVRPENYLSWLDPKLTEVSKIQELIVPFSAECMEAFPVSSKVNSPRNDSAELLRLAELFRQ